MSDTSPDPPSDPLHSALSKLRQQNSLLVTEYTSLRTQIARAIARLDSEGRRLNRAGVDSHPDREAQKRLLENAKRQAEAYAREQTTLRKKLESRCTLEAVIDLEDAVSELSHRLQEAEFENKLLRRQARLMDREEKQSLDPVAELSHVERQVEMHLRRIRDLEERQEANEEAKRKVGKRLEEAEQAAKAVEGAKRETVKSLSAAKTRAEGDAIRMQIQRLESEKQAKEQRLRQRINDLEQELKQVRAYADFVRRQNNVKIEESKLLQIKLSEVESLREIAERHKRKEMQSSRNAGSSSSSPLKKRASLRALTPVI